MWYDFMCNEKELLKHMQNITLTNESCFDARNVYLQ